MILTAHHNLAARKNAGPDELLNVQVQSTKLLDDVRAVNPEAMKQLDATLAEIQIVAEWSKGLTEACKAEDSLAAARVALERVVAAVASGELTTAQVGGLDSSIMACIRRCAQMPVSLARSLLDLSFEVKESWWRNENMMRPLVVEDLDGLSRETDEKKKKGIAQAVKSCAKAADDEELD